VCCYMALAELLALLVVMMNGSPSFLAYDTTRHTTHTIRGNKLQGITTESEPGRRTKPSNPEQDTIAS
jgi:hypothetical protein